MAQFTIATERLRTQCNEIEHCGRCGFPLMNGDDVTTIDDDGPVYCGTTCAKNEITRLNNWECPGCGSHECPGCPVHFPSNSY
jgi:hypothetical protein